MATIGQPLDFDVIGGKYADIRGRMINSTFKQHLVYSTVDVLVPPPAQVVWCRDSDSISAAFDILITNQITGMPVYDSSQDRYVGFIDLIDILVFVIEQFHLAATPTPERYWNTWATREVFGTTRVLELMGRSPRSRWISIRKIDSIQTAINVLNANRVHRVAVLDEDNRLHSILTQHRVVTYLANRTESELGDVGSMSVGQLHLGLGAVVSIHQSHPVYRAFLAMYNYGITGVAVVNDNMAVVGNISITDLKDIGYSAQMFGKMFWRCDDLLGKKVEGAGLPPLVWARHDSTIKEVLGQFRAHFIHRVYVVERNSHFPAGVITLTDIIELFASVESQNIMQS